ncbi:coproporphyrinogen III oxidase [Leptospira perolatii]|uniref:Heme chaperone HemW n=1 Tax=Leptospira perolatii TaxID=2023191 RepID=A0A2M9ZME7_9LEPT|nr:radical SAM family heme chaperone HemW [Leptospira perolatii]PJZ70064.1 coproporphyrinogen III oxidase [Leptospira perolatii]PJZ73252.1 coproporphyrinogen III oxidase [Leptospira perolatii]
MNPTSSQLPIIQKTGKAGIYLHYPFCVHKCSYCDFYSEGIGLGPSESEEILFGQYESEVMERIKRDKQVSQLSYDTVFFGGGTPSKASPERYGRFLNFLRKNLDLSPNSEITLECNPEDLSPELLKELHQAGINRVHVGIQSFSPKNLQFLERYYDPESYPRILDAFYSSPIQNFGADLMFGIPGQTEEEFYQDVDRILEAGVSHISLYALTVEKGTEYSRKVSDHISPAPLEELQASILQNLPTYLRERNISQYEVSNYSKPNLYSRHNMKYWTYEYYLGIGPGAHGFLPSGRYANPRNTNSYLRGNMDFKYQASEPFEELVLSLFRIFYPIELRSFLEIIPEQADFLLDRIKAKRELGICELEGTLFRWKPEAVLYLDSHILEFTESLQ